MRLWFDTEFIEDGHSIELLNIGVVREDGAEYHAEAAEADRGRANDWVRGHVLPHLGGPVKPRTGIAAEVRAFAGAQPEWWADYAGHDWVALCQLYGRMIAPIPCRGNAREKTDQEANTSHRGPEREDAIRARTEGQPHGAKSMVPTGQVVRVPEERSAQGGFPWARPPAASAWWPARSTGGSSSSCGWRCMSCSTPCDRAAGAAPGAGRVKGGEGR